MLDGVFHEVDEDLLDQDDVHGDHQKGVGGGDLDAGGGVMALEFHGRRAEDLFAGLELLFDVRRAGHARDREQIFDHADEPVGFVAHVFEQARAGLGRELFAVFEDRVDAADDGGQGRADVVGDGAQEIAAHFFLFGFGAELFLLLDLGGQRTDHDGDGQHDEERQGVAGDGEVQLHVGVGKDPVDAEDAEERGQQAEQVAVGKARDEDDRALKDQSDEDVGRVDHPQQRAEDGRQAEKAEAHAKIPPRKRKQLPQPRPEGLRFFFGLCISHKIFTHFIIA